ncbi:hypothetical protein AB6A40_008335 [Gnathostoma spinigerum]|uniref:Rab3-GAP regulatory subunit N-terminal domain-containing protein n=1 Tax=Gnathostoma spinigerum TaxID=75299 RepID=A0ABD6EVW7_9BILA
MWRELNVIATLSDDQLAQIHAFLLPSESNDNGFSVSSRDNDFSNPETPDNEKEDRSVNAEDEAGVADWSDFDFKPADTYEQDSVRHSGETLISRKENGRWLQHCLIAASGSAELIAVALVQRIVVLEKSAFNESCMDVIAQICVVPTAETGSVYICSLCVLPMGCARKTETSAYDWVSVAVGLSTGYVNFYTERGLLIRTELFSHGPITGMRFSESILPGNQEFVVSSHGTLIVVEGLSLYTALRFAKAEIAKGEVDLEQIAERAEINCMRLKTKLSPDGSEDFAITGSRKISSFEQYVNASLSSLGAKARCRRSALPVYSTYVFCGVNPFISFAWNEDSQPAPSLLSTAINQITSSVVSSIPSWGIRSYLGIGVSKKDLPKRAIPAYLSSSDLPIRSKLEDDGREGERIYPAPPSTHLVAVTDAKARVVLIDVSCSY